VLLSKNQFELATSFCDVKVRCLVCVASVSLRPSLGVAGSECTESRRMACFTLVICCKTAGPSVQVGEIRKKKTAPAIRRPASVWHWVGPGRFCLSVAGHGHEDCSLKGVTRLVTEVTQHDSLSFSNSPGTSTGHVQYSELFHTWSCTYIELFRYWRKVCRLR
jgi:hypothetical protein